jgi:hypothetical protein
MEIQCVGNEERAFNAVLPGDDLHWVLSVSVIDERESLVWRVIDNRFQAPQASPWLAMLVEPAGASDAERTENEQRIGRPLHTFVYGLVPPGMRQEMPERSPAPTLTAGATYYVGVGTDTRFLRGSFRQSE